MIKVYKASDKDAKDLQIVATKPIPPIDSGDSHWETYAREKYAKDANAINSALKKSLPQGTRDHLFAIMAYDRASLFRML